MLGTALTVGPASNALAQDAPGAGSIQSVVACASLTSVDVSSLNTVITSATEQAREGHDYCFVQGYISPQTQFEMLLPLTTWQGRYLQQGCGGFCGFVGVSLGDPSRTSGYQAAWAPLGNGEVAVAASNNGHHGADPADALWAEDAPALRVAFGYGSEHSLAEVAKAVIAAFYGQEPSYSYFDGVSNGGRQALILAQRYPTDFDGILAGAPGSNFAPLAGLAEAWMARANTGDDGRQVLTSEQLPGLHAAVLEACADEQGVIADPRACTFDPTTIECEAGAEGPDCLTAAQVEAVRKLYRGATDAEGRSLFNGGQPYGSELAWNAWLVQPAADTEAPRNTIAASLALGYHRHMAFLEEGTGKVGLSDLEFTAVAHDRLLEFGAVYNANDPDLTAFRDAGGKLILYHGWADEAIPPFSTVDYYRAVVETVGGFEASQSFSRLYMIPGLYHCPCGSPVIGDPATEVQFLQELADWVEQDRPPGVKELAVTASTTAPALASLEVAPFDPTLPPPENDGLNSGYDYVGWESVYQPGRALWCEQQGPTLVCTDERPPTEE
jgi:feruloyl esterase